MRVKYPDSDLAMYQIALNAAGAGQHGTAIDLAAEAVARSPANIEYRSALIRACAVGGRYDLGREVARSAVVGTRAEAQRFAVLAQFVDYCEAYPLDAAQSAFERIRQAGAYARPSGVKDLVLAAVRDERPFSLVRLGDGEGAWLSIDPYDDGRFSALYRDNRISFLNDWFGSDELIDRDDFHQFARSLQAGFQTHDIVGIAGKARLEQEESFLSTRGIPSSINTYRYLGLLKRTPGHQVFCNNSINLALSAGTNFYPELFKAARRVGIVTSQPTLAKRIAEAGVNVVSSHVIPGDSRNFHRGSDGRPECQYPTHLERINEDLARLNCRGTVFLIAAGFVGKRYIQTVRERGGVAIDLGALADYWAREGVPR